MSATQNQSNVATVSSRQTSQQDAGGTLHSAFAVTVWIAATFCLLVCVGMIFQHEIASQQDPWKSPQLLALKEKLVASQKDENLKQEIRRLDLEFRQRYSRRLSLNRTGACLLIGGMAVMLLAAKQVAKLRAPLPMPRLNPDAESHALRAAAQSRWSVAAIGTVATVTIATLAFTARSPLPNAAADWQKLAGGGTTANEVAADLPSIAEFFANWPRFRGPDGGGVSASTNGLPLTWDDKTGAGVLWKSPVPAPGFNSPIVWSNRVFISGGDATKREVFCFDTADGKLLWRRAIENVPGGPATQPKLNEQPGFAAATMATDGRRVYVSFGNGDLAALALDGAPVWSKNLGVPKNPYGHATSLAVWPGKLFVQFDQGESAPANSRLMAFDGATGRVLWERTRPVPASWATPIVIEAAGRTQIVTLGQPWMIGYAVADGAELWRAELLEGEIAPSPVFAGGLVIAVSPSTRLLALRPDGSGDVTQSAVVWSQENYLPDVTSPVSNGELVFTVTSGGVVACMDARDGKMIWQHELEMEVQSSPAIAGDRLFVTGTKGLTVELAVAREFKELGCGSSLINSTPARRFRAERCFCRGEHESLVLG